MSYLEITTDSQLIRYCHRLAKCRVIAFDTEFVSEDTFRPELCLIQIAADGELAVIDPTAIEDIRPFWVVLAANGHETIVHAGRSEVDFCLDAIGRPPSNLFDVQIGAGLAGMEYPTSYGALISRLLKKKLGKHETRTDWRRRPLSKRQIDYALDDVRHLAEIRNILGQKLEAAGRVDWWPEEMARWLDKLDESRNHDPWRRVSGNSGLDARSLAILREIYAWRNEEAAHKNRPAKRVLRDDLLIEIAKQKNHRRQTSPPHPRSGTISQTTRPDYRADPNRLGASGRRLSHAREIATNSPVGRPGPDPFRRPGKCLP